MSDIPWPRASKTEAFDGAAHLLRALADLPAHTRLDSLATAVDVACKTSFLTKGKWERV